MDNVQEFNSILRKDYNNNVKVINFKPFIISIKDYAFLNISPFPTNYCISISCLITCSCPNLCDLLVLIWRKIKDIPKVFISMKNWKKWENSGLGMSSRIQKTTQEKKHSKILWFGYALIKEIFTIKLINLWKQPNVTKKL